MRTLTLTLLLTLVLSSLNSCKKKPAEQTNDQSGGGGSASPDLNSIYGYGILKKLPGIWNGPVTSTTPLGGYPEWIVDFRPISAHQVSAKNELDSLNDIFMSFFVALHDNEYRIAFRNGGSFGGLKRVSYFLADSIAETSATSYYRFSEIVQGKSRAYTEVIFSNDSLYIKSYTNKYNTLTNPTPHMVWSAKLQDTTSAQAAISHFAFPQKNMTKDFTTTFLSVSEAVFYDLTSDPYPESAQPYLGQSTITYSYSPGFVPATGKKVFLIITTQPLFSGITFLSSNLKYRSRYVILDALDNHFVFNYMHPGTYYLYAYYDADGNKNVNSGDWLSTANTSFTLGDASTTGATTQINFIIP